MDRRTLLALTTSLPALVAEPAGACSVALKSPRSSGLQNQQVVKLFQAWWAREEAVFRAFFTDTLMLDGTLMNPKVASELHARDPISPETFAIFPRFFTEERKIRRLTLIVNTGAGVIVACAESAMSRIIESDCTGMPKLHLFLVDMSGLNPRTITHVASVDTLDIDKFGIWTESSAD